MGLNRGPSRRRCWPGVCGAAAAGSGLSLLLRATRRRGTEPPRGRAGGDDGAERKEGWLDREQASRCGRLLGASTVGFPHGTFSAPGSFLGHDPANRMSASDAARQRRTRAETVERAGVEGVNAQSAPGPAEEAPALSPERRQGRGGGLRRAPPTAGLSAEG